MQRYILTGLLKAMAAIAVVAILVVCLLRSLLFLNYIVNHGMSVGAYLYIIMLLLPSLLALVLPIAVFAAVLFVYGKLTGDNEILAMRASAMGNASLALPALTATAAATAAAYAMTLYLIPLSFKEFKDIEYFVQVRMANMVLREGEFNRLGRKITVYMRERTRKGEMRSVLIQDDRDPALSRTIMAERAVMAQTGDVYKLQMDDGSLQEYDRNNKRVSLVRFERYVLEVNAAELLGGAEREQGIAERHIGALLAPPTATHRDRELRTKALAEGHQRLSSPLQCFSYMAIALAALFAGDFNRRGSSARMVLAGALVATIQALHLLIVNAASLSAALLPAIHLNTIVPGLLATMLLYHGDRHAPLKLPSLFRPWRKVPIEPAERASR